MHGKKVNITPLFQQAGIETGRIEIIETEGMYPYKEKIEDNWAFYTAVACKELTRIFASEHKIIKDAAIVGICSGVEAIALVHLFKDQLKNVIVTDVDAEILKGTIFNLNNSLEKNNIDFIPLVGSFCEPIEKTDYLVDFVHANIPNLPASGEEDLTKGAEKGTFLKSELYDKYQPPEKFVGWALAAQYAYLQSAKKITKQNGSIITELGGRIPMNLVEELFDECGLQLQEVLVGFKEQTEALIDFIGYSKLEKEYGTSFDFYSYEESKKVLEEHKITNPTTEKSGKEIKELLAPYKVSATEALELHKQGVAVGHTVHVFRGMKN
ncbi:hypothetical protein COV18_06670 [Candidatus Woesearchaeota archaeon CG10_big_fil_rev_8_21_14_0_10_37_12]|nr:MAG: hypothetical protein COV18_06670 [Candidatus Woesearchaeota archaeon CG10_big_fil_rev_8_21_14_0_10_37_12]